MKNEVFRKILEANPERNYSSMSRRLIKVMEELGEASEAYLNITSSYNGKNKSVDDFREELVDCMVVIVDCLLTKLPGEEDMTSESIEANILEILDTKLAKWANNKKNQVTQNVDDAV